VALSPHGTITLTFAAFGSLIGTHIGAIPFLITNSHITPQQFGIFGATGMLAGSIAMGLGGVINRYLDHRTVLLIAFPLSFLALCYALLVNSLTSFGLSFIVLSVTLGWADLFMNAEGAVVERQVGRKVFSSYHGAASLVTAVFAIASSLISAFYAPWFGALLTCVPIALAMAAINKVIPHRANASTFIHQAKPALPFRLLAVIGMAAGLNVACEVAAMQWAGQLLARIAPELAAISGLGAAFYGLCGGSMRLLGDGLRERFGDVRVLATTVTIAILGFAILARGPGFWPSVFAFAAVGAGLAVVYPAMVSLAGKLAPQNAAAAMGIVAAVATAPRVVAPVILGTLAASYGLSTVFLACGIFAATALMFIITASIQSNTRIKKEVPTKAGTSSVNA
jgi:MFS family permease